MESGACKSPIKTLRSLNIPAEVSYILFIIEWDNVIVRIRLLICMYTVSPGCYFRNLDVLVSNYHTPENVVKKIQLIVDHYKCFDYLLTLFTF